MNTLRARVIPVSRRMPRLVEALSGRTLFVHDGELFTGCPALEQDPETGEHLWTSTGKDRYRGVTTWLLLERPVFEVGERPTLGRRASAVARGLVASGLLVATLWVLGVNPSDVPLWRVGAFAVLATWLAKMIERAQEDL